MHVELCVLCQHHMTCYSFLASDVHVVSWPNTLAIHRRNNVCKFKLYLDTSTSKIKMALTSTLKCLWGTINYIQKLILSLLQLLHKGVQIPDTQHWECSLDSSNIQQEFSFYYHSLVKPLLSAFHSKLNAETLKRASTSHFGWPVWCSTHGH